MAKKQSKPDNDRSEYYREYYERNRERLRLLKKERYLKNRDQELAIRREQYRKKVPDPESRRPWEVPFRPRRYLVAGGRIYFNSKLGFTLAEVMDIVREAKSELKKLADG